MSEPIRPIVYYVDRGAPEPVRSALIEGASWWNQAFEAAGYRRVQSTTGRRLYSSDSEVQTLRTIVNEKPQPPSEVVSGYPGPLEQILMKCLTKNPAERYQTARELKRALDSFVTAAGVETGTEEVASMMRDLFAERIKFKSRLLRSVEKGEVIDLPPENRSGVSASFPMGARMATTVTSAEVPSRGGRIE